jgi:hypothetical protein
LLEISSTKQNKTYSIVTRSGRQWQDRQTLNVERIFVRSRKMPTFPVTVSVAYLGSQSTK